MGQYDLICVQMTQKLIKLPKTRIKLHWGFLCASFGVSQSRKVGQGPILGSEMRVYSDPGVCHETAVRLYETAVSFVLLLWLLAGCIICYSRNEVQLCNCLNKSTQGFCS